MHTRRRAAQDQDPAPSVDPAPDQQDTAAAVKKREKQEENARKKEEMTKKKDEAARKRKETIARKKEEAAKRAAETQLDQELLEVAHDDAVAKEAARVAAAKLRESSYGLWLKTTIDSHAAPTTGRAAKDQAAKKTTDILNANKRQRKKVDSDGEQAPPSKRHANGKTSKDNGEDAQTVAPASQVGPVEPVTPVEPVKPVKPVKPAKNVKEMKESDDEEGDAEGDDEHSENDQESSADEDFAAQREQKKLQEQLEDAEPVTIGNSEVVNTTIAPRKSNRRSEPTPPSGSDVSEDDMALAKQLLKAHKAAMSGKETSATPSRSKKASSTPMDVDKQPETGADLSEEDRVRAWRLLWFYSERNRSKVSSPMDFEVDEGPAPGTAFLGEDYALAMKLLKGYKWNDVMFYGGKKSPALATSTRSK
ncbi:hypothetical protein PENSPDRAFT_672264, partial [Peniophora sp. CONT]